jgi:hypothetical protein
VDEVITPQSGNCSIFARYVEPNFATQVILTARLTRLYERRDWQARFAFSKPVEPLLLERGVTLDLKPSRAPAAGPDRDMMERALTRVQQMESMLPPFTPLAQMKAAYQARKEAAQEK